MPEQEHNPIRAEELDRMIDAALAKYAAVEPRAGLEQRILANLNSQPEKFENRRWHWSIVGALAVVIVAGLALTWRSSRHTHPVAANHPAIAAPDSQPRQNHFEPQSDGARLHRAHRSTPKMQRQPQTLEANSANPKLEKFPSPQPLNEQEKMLASYVAQFHDEAVLIARARTAASKREQEEMQGTDVNRSNDSQAR